MTAAPDACAADRQRAPVPGVSRTQERPRAVLASGADGAAAMLRPPLYRNCYDKGPHRVYTAACRPAEVRATYVRPGVERRQQPFGGFVPGSATVTLGAPR